MITHKHVHAILSALPDPAFLISASGKYVAAFGGKDQRYYQESISLVGSFVTEVFEPDIAEWALNTIARAIETRTLLTEEYEIKTTEVKRLPNEDPSESLWFEGRIQVLDFLIDDEPVVLWVATNISGRHALEEKLRYQSCTDQLTGLYNRHKLIEELTGHYHRFLRHGVPTSVVIFDLDNLKQINDTCGHHCGDKALQIIAGVCRQQLRKNDIACRFGGDEFVIALPDVGPKEAFHFAERLHACLNAKLEEACQNGPTATASFGISTIHGDDASYEDALKRADEGLYRAKKQGKNQICTND